jgi:hypothetical protein
VLGLPACQFCVPRGNSRRTAVTGVATLLAHFALKTGSMSSSPQRALRALKRRAARWFDFHTFLVLAS